MRFGPSWSRWFRFLPGAGALFSAALGLVVSRRTRGRCFRPLCMFFALAVSGRRFRAHTVRPDPPAQASGKTRPRCQIWRVLVHRAGRTVCARKRLPLTASAKNIHNGRKHLPRVHRLTTSPSAAPITAPRRAARKRNQRLQLGPKRIRYRPRLHRHAFIVVQNPAPKNIQFNQVPDSSLFADKF